MRLPQTLIPHLAAPQSSPIIIFIMSNTNFSLLSTLLCSLILFQQVSSLTYWVDESCKIPDEIVGDGIRYGTDGVFRECLGDTKYLAARALERLDDEIDTNQGSLFNFFFRVPRNNGPQFSRVKGK